MNLYDRVTKTIIRQLEEKPDRLPWHGELNIPANFYTKHCYQGVNAINLWAQAMLNAHPTHLWATERQWGLMGATIKNNEEPTDVVYFNPGKKETVDSGLGGKIAIAQYGDSHARAWEIFNYAQVEGCKRTPPQPVKSATGKRRKPQTLYIEADPDTFIDRAEEFFEAQDAHVVTKGDDHFKAQGCVAYYSKSLDRIYMPHYSKFEDASSYYSVLGHEHIHWTGAKDRLNRLKGCYLASPEYAFEELVAELGAAFICASLGIENMPRPDHARYIRSWISGIKHDNRLIFKAASKAQRAEDWMFEKVTPVEMKRAA